MKPRVRFYLRIFVGVETLKPPQEYRIYNVKIILSCIKSSQGVDILLTVQDFGVEVVKERALELGTRNG